jgi:uncharacterized membrane protein (Fun14 family)
MNSAIQQKSSFFVRGWVRGS